MSDTTKKNAKNAKNASQASEAVETVNVQHSVERNGKMPKRVRVDLAGIRSVFEDCGIKQDASNRIVSIPAGTDVTESLLKHATISGKSAQTWIDSLKDEDGEKIKNAVISAFLDLLKVARFRHSTVKTADLRERMVECRSSLNETVDKKLVASINNMIAHLPDAETVTGKAVLSRKETGEGRGTVGSNLLAKINFPVDESVKNYDPADYGIAVTADVRKNDKIDPIDLL